MMIATAGAPGMSSALGSTSLHSILLIQPCCIIAVILSCRSLWAFGLMLFQGTYPREGAQAKLALRWLFLTFPAVVLDMLE